MVVHGIGSPAVLNDGQVAGVAIGAVTRATKVGRGTRCLPRPNR
jgi:hypothetical protein